jgi:hybrid cluster-associated redox disulfide protein
MPIRKDQLVDDVMRRWPETIRVFLDYGFHCVGCPIGCFHSVEDACREHHANLALFLADLNTIVSRAGCDDESNPAASRLA